MPTAVLVEDNLMFALPLQAALKNCGYEVLTLAGRPSDLDRVVGALPSLLVINLAGRFSGAEFIRTLRSCPELSELPIVGYAGHVERDRLQQGLAAGADLVAPNSAMHRAMPEVLAKLEKRRAGLPTEEFPED